MMMRPAQKPAVGRHHVKTQAHLTQIVFRPWWRLSRGLTLGVRAVVERDGAVLLVRHSYVPGWYFPGGGVERGETAVEALARELVEEAAVSLDAPPRLFGVYSNNAVHRGDHVILYIAEAWRQIATPRANREILEARFFALDDLPSGTTPATRRRVAEVFDAAPQSDHW
jgi:ADP-ribose pyrophosphatase YjhB (NUDIX family)